MQEEPMPLVRALLGALVGLLCGGGLNLVIYRLPRSRPLFRRPRCTGCGRPLSWEAIPLAGYLLQRGRCRHCGERIPRSFPLVEGLTALVFGALAGRLGWTPLAALYGVFALALILTLFLDWLHRDIYYLILLPATALALLAPFLRIDPRLQVRNALLGLGVGLLFFGVLFLLGRTLFRTAALALGDVWLAGMIGAMAEFRAALLTLAAGILLAALGAGWLLLLRKSAPGDYMPYGAYLCLATLGFLALWAPL
jgi:leader peptidase (prepilin peptidase)/N-methyltransferase